MDIKNSTIKRSKANINGWCYQLYIDYDSKEVYFEACETVNNAQYLKIPINKLKKEYNRLVIEGFKNIDVDLFKLALIEYYK